MRKTYFFLCNQPSLCRFVTNNIHSSFLKIATITGSFGLFFLLIKVDWNVTLMIKFGNRFWFCVSCHRLSIVWNSEAEQFYREGRNCYTLTTNRTKHTKSKSYVTFCILQNILNIYLYKLYPTCTSSQVTNDEQPRPLRLEIFFIYMQWLLSFY